MQDRYHDPGRPLLERNAQGFSVLQTTASGDGIYFSTAQAPRPKATAPFIAVMPLTGENPTEKRVWQSQAPYYELGPPSSNPPAAFKSSPAASPLTRAPTTSSPRSTAPPQRPARSTQVTDFPNPYAGIALPSHQLLHYKRDDGVDLTADLYLPAGYDKSKGPLPTLMEAYPAEFKSRAAASQVTGSPYEFVRIGAGTPIFFTMTGYAVLANAAIPIIGEGNTEPNDTYVEQLVAGAKAAMEPARPPARSIAPASPSWDTPTGPS